MTCTEKCNWNASREDTLLGSCYVLTELSWKTCCATSCQTSACLYLNQGARWRKASENQDVTERGGIQCCVRMGMTAHIYRRSRIHSVAKLLQTAVASAQLGNYGVKWVEIHLLLKVKPLSRQDIHAWMSTLVCMDHTDSDVSLMH